jgi:hypothetical protein
MHTHPHGMLLLLITRINLLSIFLTAITAILDSQQSVLLGQPALPASLVKQPVLAAPPAG